jgi:nucleoside-diphosphate-sugar epimerase
MHFFSTLFFSELVQITHVMHLAAPAVVRYAMENPGSDVRSNIAQLVNRYL